MSDLDKTTQQQIKKLTADLEKLTKISVTLSKQVAMLTVQVNKLKSKTQAQEGEISRLNAIISRK